MWILLLLVLVQADAHVLNDNYPPKLPVMLIDFINSKQLSKNEFFTLAVELWNFMYKERICPTTESTSHTQRNQYIRTKSNA